MKNIKFKIPQGTTLPNFRKHLNADALFSQLRAEFAKIKDARASNARIPLKDALMSGFAVFSLKDPSLLAFDERRRRGEPNLKRVYGIGQAPSDSQLRDILDQVDPACLRKPFKQVFAQIQRGKVLEQIQFLGRYYLVSGDGTGYYYSQKVGNDLCLEKVHGNSHETAYYQQFYGACLVHPDYREVIPFCPEPILKQDGQSKNDCERLASKRFMTGLRQDHPHLPVVMVEDALHANAPHIRDLKQHHLRFIIGVKEKDHRYLFEQIDEAKEAGQSIDLTLADPDNPNKRHRFHFVNDMPLNKANKDLRVNFLEYWEITLDKQGRENKTYFSWVTDLKVTATNVYELMRGGRARWRIENETFNTLKNQGYHLEHNYGLGKKHLSPVFMTLTMLAFLVDQTQQLSCGLYRAAWRAVGAKTRFFERIRSLFLEWDVDSMETLYKAIHFGIKRSELSESIESG